MRTASIAAIFLSIAGLYGCSTGSSLDALNVAPPPSRETTSSVARPGADVGAVEETEGNGYPTDASVTALAEDDGPTSRAATQVAAIMPQKPSARPDRPERREVTRHRFRDAHPINFGRAKPQDHPVHGVDVSRWQGEIDWVKLRSQGANFAYIKATDGGDHLDPKFHENWRGAAAAGIKRGAYHFFYWCRTAASQAEWFIRNVPKEKGALPPVIDVEWNHQSSCKKRPPRSDILDKIRVFSERLERHYGQRPIIYTAPDFYADNLRGAFPDHPFWLRSVAAHPSKVYPGRKWLFWQYSGSGLSGGVDGKIDLNVFAGDEDDWWRWVGKVSG